MKKYNFCIILFLASMCWQLPLKAAERFVTNDGVGFEWIQKDKSCPILVDNEEYKGVLRAITNLQTDAQAVTNVKPFITNTVTEKRVLIIGSIDRSNWIKRLISSGKIPADELKGKREKYILCTIKQPLEGVEEAVVIAGSDKRGTIYGIYELSSQMGVSPWYYWTDVPVKRQNNISILPGSYTDGEPAIEYRGIFLNDEWPALGNWTQKAFGGFNSQFYEKVFELILRLKGNFMWPAMWASAFYDDDVQNGVLADEMGIVMGTSHHEPMGLAQQDWKRRGTGAWDYTQNATVLRDFWTKGMERCKDWESVITIGMRGDGDMPMSKDANIDLLQNIVKDQRKIITKVTGKKISATPQVWALYKEVQEYYDKGMRVPDDITLLLCDDNWGNVRKLPSLTDKPRKGGYGMYYHFDYVGGPRNYKWLNCNQVERVWEQMNLCYEYGVRKLWIVNVGDLKPMEYPIQFFLDMAWRPEAFNPNNIFEHTITFAAQQFGEEHAKEIADIIKLYSKYARRVTPELLNANTYQFSYDEWPTVVREWNNLELRALRVYQKLDPRWYDAYEELVLFPIQAMQNIYEMYYSVAMNAKAESPTEINYWAQRVEKLYERDSLLCAHYNHEIANGKWDHMMDQVHIGYTYWQQPEKQVMPKVKKSDEAAYLCHKETDGYISIEAGNFKNNHKATVIPDLGKTECAVTTLPASVTPDNAYVEYEIETVSSGKAKLSILLAPTLNFNANKGLCFAISVDGGQEQIINFNGHYSGKVGPWQAASIIKTDMEVDFGQAGRHDLRFRFVDPGVVMEKMLIDFGGLKSSYLGAPSSKLIK